MKMLSAVLMAFLMITGCVICFADEAGSEINTLMEAAGIHPAQVQSWGDTAACLGERDGTKHLLVMENRDGGWQVVIDNSNALIQDADWPELYLDSDNAVFWTYTLSDHEVLRYHSMRDADGKWGAVDQYYADSGFGDYTHIWATWWDAAHGGEIIRSFSIEDENGNEMDGRILQYLPAGWLGEYIHLAELDMTRFPTFIDLHSGTWFETDRFFMDAAAVLMPDRICIKGCMKDGVLHFLMQNPDGSRVYVICEYESQRTPNLIESSPLPDETVLGHENFTDSLWINDSCVSIQLLNQNAAGIEYIYRDETVSGTADGFLFFGDRTVWGGMEMPAQTLLYGDHPWDDITQIDWNHLPHSLDEAAAQMDSSRYAVVVNPNPADRLHLRERNDKGSRSQGKYYTGTPVSVLRTNGDWTQAMIGRIPEGGRQGWMMKRYMTFGQAGCALRLDTSAMLQLSSRDEILKVYDEPQIGAYTCHRGDTFKVIGIIGSDWYHIWFPATGAYGFVRQSDLTEGNG
ncbi:MAG: hypothetical protein IJT77_03605 [Clostridia bacterium]|nr:hypothetical protein [Clostridia bacterium]